MPEEPSTTADQNHCQPAIAISEQENGNPRPCILTFAKWLRRIGYLMMILTLAWIFFYHYAAWNYFHVDKMENLHEIEQFLDIGSKVAFVLCQIAFGAITFSILMCKIIKQENADKQMSSSFFSTKHIVILIMWWLPVFVGITFLCVNILGYTEKSDEGSILHLQGWPITHSAIEITCSDPDDSWALKILTHFFSTYWAIVDSILAILIVLCNILSVKYIIRRWSNKRQYFLKEILVLVTATAFFLSLMTIEQFTFPRDRYNIIPEDWYTYQPLHALPLYMQIPILIGITCVVMDLGTAFFELFGISIAKIIRIDDEKD